MPQVSRDDGVRVYWPCEFNLSLIQWTSPSKRTVPEIRTGFLKMCTNQPVRCLPSLYPTFKIAQIVHKELSIPATAMMHPGNHEEAKELLSHCPSTHEPL